MGLPPDRCATYIIFLDQCYTRSERSIASSYTIRKHLLHMDHPLDLRCHLLHFVCSPFEVEGEGEGEGELIGEVMVEMVGEVIVEMVGEVMVKMVREVIVHLSRHCLLPYPPYLPITRYFHTSPGLRITRYFYTPTNLHITFHTPTHLRIFTIFGVARASFHGSRYHLIIPPFIIPYISFHR